MRAIRWHISCATSGVLFAVVLGLKARSVQFLVFRCRGSYELAEIPPSQIPLAQSTHFGIIFTPTSSKFERGRHGHIFLLQ